MKQRETNPYLLPHFQAQLLESEAEPVGNTTTMAGFKISFVRAPAINRHFMAFGADGLATVSYTKLALQAQKQMVTGPVLIPNQPIRRLNEEGQAYYVSFSEETIAQLAKLSLKQLPPTTDEHSENLNHPLLIESWLVADPKLDKAAFLGLADLPKGTWMATYHIPDKAYWDTEIATGNRKGFSIEGMFALVPHPEQAIFLSEAPSETHETDSQNLQLLLAQVKEGWKSLKLKLGMKQGQGKEASPVISEAELKFDAETLQTLLALQADALQAFDEQMRAWAQRWGSIEEQLSEVEKQIKELQQAPATLPIEEVPVIGTDISLAESIARKLQFLPEE